MRIFGAPIGSLSDMKGIIKGTTLFLRNIQSNIVHGPFWATTKVGKHINRSAFGGRFPAQVRIVHNTHIATLPVQNTPLKGIRKNRWLDVSKTENLVAQLSSAFPNSTSYKESTTKLASVSSAGSTGLFGSQVLRKTTSVKLPGTRSRGKTEIVTVRNVASKSLRQSAAKKKVEKGPSIKRIKRAN